MDPPTADKPRSAVWPSNTQRDHGAHPGTRVLAEPDRDLLLHRQRKVVSPDDFTDPDNVIDRLSAFESRYNQTARPFKWKFTTTDMDNFLDRLDSINPRRPQTLLNPARHHPHELTSETT